MEKSHREDLLIRVKRNIQAIDNLHSLDAFSLQQEITDTKVKLLAAENAQQIRQQLKLQKGCPGCEYTKSLFTENKVEFFQNHLEEIFFKAAALAVHNTHSAEKELKKTELDLQQVANAQKRIERLAEIQNQREAQSFYKKKIEEKQY